MAHSYEELRSAAFDVLSGRVTAWGATQYGVLKKSIAVALQVRDQKAEADSFYGRQVDLDAADAEIYLEVFWDLFRQNVITLGTNDSNPAFPFCRVTALGLKVANGENGYFVHDVSSYEQRLRTEIPDIDDVTILYLKESLQAFRSGCILSCTVMLGVATEQTFLNLVEVIDTNSIYGAAFAKVGKEKNLVRKVNAFKKVLDSKLNSLPQTLRDDIDTHFVGILSVIRNFRNESGHPSGKIIDREQAYVLLQLFPHYCKKMYQLINYFQLP